MIAGAGLVWGELLLTLAAAPLGVRGYLLVAPSPSALLRVGSLSCHCCTNGAGQGPFWPEMLEVP